MSDRWPGGIISKTPVIPTGPSETGSAPGVWTLDQASYWQKQGLWPTQLLRDPYFPYVTMLLSTTSLNGGQNNTFLDSSGNNFTFTNVNTPTQGSFSPYGSNWSGYFDGSGDYLDIAANSAFDLSGDFTLEFWVNTTRTADSWITGYYVSNPGFTSQVGYLIAISGGNYIVSLNSGSTETVITIGTASSISNGAWNHIACTRSGNTVRTFVNGTLTSTTTYSSTLNNPGGAVYRIGGITGTFEDPFAGYISNMRLVKGTALYTSNFTPSTTPLTAVSGTSLLTCAYNRFRDGSSNNFTITVNGDSKTTDFSPFAPASPYSAATNGGSLVFNGSNEATYVDSSNAALTLGTGDFTIELWVYQRVLGGAQSWVSTYGGPGSGYRFSPTNTLQFSWGDSDVLTSSATPDINQWCHVAVTRSGSTVRIFKNGVVVATGTNSTDLTGGSTQTTLGRIPTYNTWYYNGYMSDVRIVKGTAVYTANFTPPTAPLTAISGTSLLARGTNSNVFDAASMNDIRTAADAQVSTAQAKFGTTSVYFDGSGDCLVTPNNTVLDLGGGDCTAECWVYFNSTANYPHLFEIGTSAAVRGVVYQTGGNIRVYSNGADRIIGSTAISTGIWYHVALARVSGTYTLYVNGVSQGTYAGTVFPNAPSELHVGFQAFNGSAADYLNGYIDDLRITKGYARYTSNFTPPAAAFPTA